VREPLPLRLPAEMHEQAQAQQEQAGQDQAPMGSNGRPVD
jgi:hypothetical protein